jgi:WD40 repeat protein
MRARAAPILLVVAAAALAGAWARPYFREAAELRAPEPAAAPHEKVRALAFDAAGRLLTVGAEGEMKVWDPEAHRPLDAWRLSPPERPFLAAAFSADASRLAVARLDGPLQVWDVPRRALLRSFRSPDAESFGFSMLSLSGNGRRLAVAPAMGQLRVWDVASGAELLALRSDNAHWGTLALSPSGDRLARGGHSPLQVWDVQRGRLEERPEPASVDPPAIAWAPAGDEILLAPNPGDKLPDDLLLISARGLRRFPAAPAPATAALAASPDGYAVAAPLLASRRAAPAGHPQPAIVPQVWERATGVPRFDRERLLPFRGHDHLITAIAWSRDAARLATGDLAGEVLLWDAHTGAPLWRVR